ncbi:hypothetical protein AMTRI_Chr09g35990 [Amborella trichopoda]
MPSLIDRPLSLSLKLKPPPPPPSHISHFIPSIAWAIFLSLKPVQPFLTSKSKLGPPSLISFLSLKTANPLFTLKSILGSRILTSFLSVKPAQPRLTQKSNVGCRNLRGFSSLSTATLPFAAPSDSESFNFMAVNLLKECSATRAVDHGKKIHACSIINGLISNVFIGTSLISLYVKCNDMPAAVQVFDRMPHKNVVTWTTMICGSVQNQEYRKAWDFFNSMVHSGVQGNDFTFAGLLSSICGFSHGRLKGGMMLHAVITGLGLGCFVVVGNALLTMYSKCGALEDSCRVFEEMTERDVVSWSAMVAAYGQHGIGEKTIELLMEMQHDGVRPNMHTLASILGSLGELGSSKVALQLHSLCHKSGLASHSTVSNALFTAYSKCGDLDLARDVFNGMDERDVISWTAIIAAYGQFGDGHEAMGLYKAMRNACVHPNDHTFISVLDACTTMNDLSMGKQLHGNLTKHGLDMNVSVSNTMITLYAKCGCIEDARQVFKCMVERNISSWNAIIVGLAQHGQGREGLRLFDALLHNGYTPDDITFIGVLSSCTHLGMVQEGLSHFNSMTRDYSITPRMDHCGCIVDLLGRAGLLNEAKEFIDNMPLEPDPVIWATLLGACKTHKNIKLGKIVANKLLKLEPDSAPTHVMMSNMYASANMWEDVAQVRKMMKDKGLKKVLGCSWVTVNNASYLFTVGELNNPQTSAIFAMWDRLVVELKKAGYVPDIESELHDVQVQEKANMLGHHSEKLAITFGLLNTPPGACIRVTKNLRVCGDCHTATRYISKVTGREIIMRDATRFHHFKDGTCSCQDYW